MPDILGLFFFFNGKAIPDLLWTMHSHYEVLAFQ